MSDILLVTTQNYNLGQIKQVRTFENIDWGLYDAVIFHSTVDAGISVIKELTALKGKVDKILYINNKINPLYFCIFTWLGADIFESEDYLMDADLLEFLVGNYGSNGDLTMKSADSDIETIANSIATISSSSVDGLQKLLTNPYWTQTLTTAVSNIDNAVSMANQININVVDMLSEAIKLVKGLEEVNEKTSDEISKLNNIINEMDKSIKPSMPFIFSEYAVQTHVPKVLYIKMYGNCKYLNSFILAYQNYLKMTKGLKVKVLFMMPKLKIFTQRYQEGVSRLASDTLNFVDFGATDNFITFEPKKNAMDAFFNQKGAQLFIVVDAMFGDNLIRGHMVTTLFAGSSLNDIARFKLDAEKTITSISSAKNSIHITHIPEYVGSNNATRLALYVKKCGVSFEKLNGHLSL